VKAIFYDIRMEIIPADIVASRPDSRRAARPWLASLQRWLVYYPIYITRFSDLRDCNAQT
jgi:hypothetical protein